MGIVNAITEMIEGFKGGGVDEAVSEGTEEVAEEALDEDL